MRYDGVGELVAVRAGRHGQGGETFDAGADRSKWLLPGPGLVYLQVLSEVGTTVTRLESWTSAPAQPPGQWAGHEEIELDLPEGELQL